MSIVVSVDLANPLIEIEVRGRSFVLNRGEAARLSSFLREALRENLVLDSRVGYAAITQANNPFSPYKYSHFLGKETEEFASNRDVGSFHQEAQSCQR